MPKFINPLKMLDGLANGVNRGGAVIGKGQIGTNQYETLISNIATGENIQSAAAIKSAVTTEALDVARNTDAGNWIRGTQNSSIYQKYDNFVHKNSKVADDVTGSTRRTVEDIRQESVGKREMLKSHRDSLTASRETLSGVNADTGYKPNQILAASQASDMMGADVMKLNAQLAGSYVEEGLGYAKRGVQYLGEGGARAAALKIGGAAAVYGGVNMTGRALTGGGVTYNNKGERDIAGIPFF